ncbi:hypothetical protein [Escherichia coli]
MGKVNSSISTGLRRASAVLLLYQRETTESAAFHAADAAYPRNDI